MYRIGLPEMGEAMTDTPNIPAPIRAQPSGIGGWLILPMLVTCVSPLFTLKTLADVIGITMRPTFSGYPPSLKIYCAGEILINAAIICAWLVAIVMLFKHKAKYPALFNGILLFILVVLPADLWIGYSAFDVVPDVSDFGYVIRALLSCLIWIPYMLSSERVRNTFVN
jgi:hypothetical protein